MKSIFVASDVHGSALWCEKMLAAFDASGADRLLLLGAVLYHGPRNDLPRDYAPKAVIPMLSGLKERILAVRGNCEAEVDQMVLPFACMADYALLECGGKTIYLTHGPPASPDNLPPLPAGSIFLSGHTHVKIDRVVDGIRCLNPGSVSIPKDGSHSCLILEDGEFRFHIWEAEA